MAAGRVTTGVSDVYVALYTAPAGTATTATYASGQKLARLVNAEISLDDPGGNNFYADNILAETDPSLFTSGTLTLTVDGLKDAANKLIYGLPTADAAGWTHYGLNQSVPFVGAGFVIRVQEDQNVSYVPVALPKVMFNPATTTAATQEDSIDWQTQELTARINRDDTPNMDWKWLGEATTSLSSAVGKIKTAFSIT